MRASAEWKPKLRWLMRRILLLRPSRRPLESPSRIAARIPFTVLAQGAGEADERSKARAAGPGQPGVQVRGRQCRVGQVVEQPEFLAQQEGAVEPPVVVLDFPEGGELADGLAFGRLEQRPAGALDPAAGRGVRALVEVPFVAADLVGGARSEPADVERVKADLGLWDGGADGALVLAAHVDRDRPDRVLARPELVEEALQGGAVAPRLAPHDRARAVVGDAGQVAVMAAVADLVDADADQALEAALVEVVGDDAFDDPPDRVPADPQQAADRSARHLLGQPRDDVLEVARVRGARPGPRHRLHPHPAIAAVQQAQL